MKTDFYIVSIIGIASVLSVCYTALMLLYRYGWSKQPCFTIPDGFTPSTVISIIIPARNEADNIGACIRSILAQQYPRHFFEIIVIDDHSTDGTTSVAESFDGNITCIRLVDHIEDAEIIAYKKKALATGISMARGELIVTTDADCIAHPQWLLHLAAVYEAQKPVMIVAPVDFISNDSLVSIFQSLDFMSMQGITAATHMLKLGNMCNGANLAFSKKAYQMVNGYNGIDNLASGDDYLLMMKMQKAFHGRISYLKSPSAIIRTLPQPDWRSFLQQRIRWASKSGKYDDKTLTTVLLLVYIYNLAFMLLCVYAFFSTGIWGVVLAMLMLKAAVELFFLYPVARFFGKSGQLIIFPLLQPVHIMYIIVAGLLGFIGVYRWKGRTVR